MLKLKVIACDVLNREISYLGSRSRCFTDVTFLHQGLHRTPRKLKTIVQQEICKANEGFPYNYSGTDNNYDYIILGYGLCSNGIEGISSEKIPLVIPRGHDCITLLLGSKEKYKEYFDNNPGTYWFSSGWIERGGQPGEEMHKAIYNRYVEKYGVEDADYLMDMEQSWLKDYRNAALINWNCLTNSDYYRHYTKESAKYLNWGFTELDGDPSLLERMLNGKFDESEVLVVPPGKKVVPSYDQDIITYK